MSSTRHTRVLLFFFNDTATPEIYTLSLHDALPICGPGSSRFPRRQGSQVSPTSWCTDRSEEHTSELQSHHDIVCRLLLEKKISATNFTLARNVAPTYTRCVRASCMLIYTRSLSSRLSFACS